MKLSVCGLGYVGCVSSACFAQAGNEVIGVDINPLKVDIVNSGRSPIIEFGIEELIAQAVKSRSLRATTDAAEAIDSSDISLVCVGTPSRNNGSLDLSYIKNACQQIGTALGKKSRYHIVAIRSTTLPGTFAETITPTLEMYSGKHAGRDFGVAINPEFLREGTSIQDFNNPPFTLIGADNEDAAAPLRQLFGHIDAPLITLHANEAEMVKYACNCFHALKVTFANEIGNICRALGMDSHRIMDVFCQDRKLNLSSCYLKPGFAFGGSCLPKDLRAITHKAKSLDIEAPVLDAILRSNRKQVELAIDMVLRTNRKQIGVLGMSFKPGTDDLRESPMVTLIEALIGKGLKLAIYDREIELARLFGANKEYVEREIPHISCLLRSDLREVLEASDLLIIGKKSEEYSALTQRRNTKHIIIDLVRMFENGETKVNYQGLCW